MAPFSLQKSTKIRSKFDFERHHVFDRFLHRFLIDFRSIWEANLDPKASPWKGVMLPISAQRCAWQPERAQTTKIDPKWRPPTPKILPKWSPKTLPPEIPTSHLGEICGVDFLDPPTNKLYIITANRLSLFTGPAECAKRSAAHRGRRAEPLTRGLRILLSGFFFPEVLSSPS